MHYILGYGVMEFTGDSVGDYATAVLASGAPEARRSGPAPAKDEPQDQIALRQTATEWLQYQKIPPLQKVWSALLADSFDGLRAFAPGNSTMLAREITQQLVAEVAGFDAACNEVRLMSGPSQRRGLATLQKWEQALQDPDYVGEVAADAALRINPDGDTSELFNRDALVTALAEFRPALPELPSLEPIL